MNPLLQILARLGLGAGQGLAGALQQQGNPQAFAQAQENQRQQQAQAFQAQQRQTLSAAEKAQLDANQQASQTAAAQQDFANRLNLTKGIASGELLPSKQGEPGAQQYSSPVEGTPDIFFKPGANRQNQMDLLNLESSGKFREVNQDDPGALGFQGKYFKPIPPEDQAGMFSYSPSDADKKSYPWMPPKVTMPVKDFPTFLADMGKLRKDAPQSAMAYEESLKNQLSQLVDSKDPMRSTYEFMIHDALNPEDGSAPDHKRAFSVIDDIRKDKAAVETERRKLQLQGTPEALQILEKRGEAQAKGQAKGQNEIAAENLPDDTLLYWWKQIKRGAVSYDNVLSKFDKAGKERFANFVGKLGDDSPVPLSAGAQKTLSALEPVLDSLKGFQRQLEPYKTNTTPMTLFADRLAYSLGDSDLDSLISTGEMDKIRGASQSLTGLRSSLPLLDKAFIHTPNFWRDSGRQMYEKVNTMVRYLENQTAKTYKYGAKTGIVQPTPGKVSLNDILEGKQ